MVRVLAAASGGEGHLGPLLAFVDAALRAGDQVVVVVPPEQEATIRVRGLEYVLTAGVAPAAVSAIHRAMADAGDIDRVRLAEVELFGRLCTDAALPTLEVVCDWFRPDLILREPCDYASAIVAHRSAILTAQIAISPGTADWDGLHFAAQVVEPIEPGVTAMVEQAPYLSRFPSIDSPFPDCRAYGFTIGLDHREVQNPPLIWITFGTVNSRFDAQADTWQAALRAVEDLPVQAVASVGRAGPRLAAPSNTSIVDWIELPEILARASLIVCHGGSGTTLAALSAGIPLVVIPLLADQGSNATMVEELGAGVAIRPDSDGPLRGLTLNDAARVRAAITDVLVVDAYSTAARRVADDLTGRPTITELMDRLRAQVH